MVRRATLPRAAVVLAALALAPAAAAASTWNVALSGSDAAGCGGASSPCRTLSFAIASASAGDSIVVAPGRYGDLDGDGLLGEPGEEAPGGACGCMVHVDERLAVRSRDGAATVVLDAAGSALAVVAVNADGAVFGAKSRGFTLVGSAPGGFGLRVTDATAGATVAGNVAHSNATGFFVQGDAQRILDNRAHANLDAGFHLAGSAHEVERNAADSNAAGFELEGSGHVLDLNLAIGNDRGFRIEGIGHLISRCSVLGSRGYGVWVLGSASASFDRCNLVANDAAAGNCAVRNESLAAVSATRSWWGAPGGPGIDPADAVCDLGGSVTVIDPVATREIRIQLAPLR